MSELYRRISLADRRERAARQREVDSQSREAIRGAKTELLDRFRSRLEKDDPA